MVRHTPSSGGYVGRFAAPGGRFLAAIALAAAVALGATACTSADADSEGASANVTSGAPSAATKETDAPAAASGVPDTAATDGSQTPGVEEGQESPASLPPPLPNTVSAAPSKVSRTGQAAKPSVSAAAVPFTAPAKYGDKTVLTVTKASKQVESGNGPGVFAGREFVNFELSLANGGKERLDLNSVVVTAYYGSKNQLAAPIYTPSAGTADFTGTLAPGATATASYGFAVPASELGKVTMVVDFDAAHSSAMFTGAVKPS